MNTLVLSFLLLSSYFSSFENNSKEPVPSINSTEIHESTACDPNATIVSYTYDPFTDECCITFTFSANYIGFKANINNAPPSKAVDGFNRVTFCYDLSSVPNLVIYVQDFNDTIVSCTPISSPCL